MLLLQPNLFKASLFTSSLEAPISFTSLFMTSSHPRRGRPAFHLAPCSWPKKTIFSNLSSFIHRTWPSHLNLSFIIALESGIQPHLRTTYYLKLRQLGTHNNRRQFLWKISSKLSSTFQSANASEPYLTTFITVASNIPILVCRLIFLFFQTFFNYEVCNAL